MKVFKLVLILALVAISAANLMFFVFWFSASEVTAIMPISPTGYTVEALALNITILEMILVLVGFILAALGLFGYAEIKEAAVSRAIVAAEKEARKTSSEQFLLFKAAQQGITDEVPEHSGNYSLDDQTTEGATPATDE